MTTTDQLIAFIKRQRGLLIRERDTEIEQSALLLTNCGPKLLEQKGLIESERPGCVACNLSPLIPPHIFRPGEVTRIEDHLTAGAKPKSAGKNKKVGADKPTISGKQIEGIVYKVTDVRIVLAVDPAESSTNGNLDLPEGGCGARDMGVLRRERRWRLLTAVICHVFYG